MAYLINGTRIIAYYMENKKLDPYFFNYRWVRCKGKTNILEVNLGEYLYNIQVRRLS